MLQSEPRILCKSSLRELEYGHISYKRAIFPVEPRLTRTEPIPT